MAAKSELIVTLETRQYLTLEKCQFFFVLSPFVCEREIQHSQAILVSSCFYEFHLEYEGF